MNQWSNLWQAKQLGGFIRYLLYKFEADGCRKQGAALTYTTLFAVVPLMTVTYSMLSWIPSMQGVGEQVQGFIFQHFVPSSGDTVQRYLQNFSNQARQLTWVGLILLVGTVYMMIVEIERALNKIWHVTESRRGISSFLIYWAVISLGPLLMGVGFVLSSYLVSLAAVQDTANSLGIKEQLLGLLPIIFSAAAFTLIYAAVPNCRVPVKHALVGGVVVALLFEMAKWAFSQFVQFFPSFNLIYGAFAAVPLFLFWLYISWLIILMGAELVQGLAVYRLEKGQGRQSHLHALLSVLYALWQAHQTGDSLSEQMLLASLSRRRQDDWQSYVRWLTQRRLILRTNKNHLALAQDLEVLSLADFIKHLPWSLPYTEAFGRQSESWEHGLASLLSSLEQQLDEVAQISLAQLFRRQSDYFSDTAPGAELGAVRNAS